MKAVTVKRTLLLVLALLFILLLANVLVGCGTVRNDPEPEPTPAPPVETPFELRLGALTLTPETERAAFDGADAPIDALIGAQGELKALREIDLGLTGASMEELRALEEAYPQAEVKWKVSVLGEEIDGRAESLELCAAADEDVSDLVSALALLPEVKTIVLAPEDGVTALSFESLDALAAAAPEAELECRFELFGQTADWTTEKLKYCKTEIGNEGVELFREALPYLRSLTLLRFEECGITDNDMMAQLRDDFPATKVVWSIPIEGYIFMTDTTLINAGILLRDDNAHLLEYMPDVLYFDIGHYKGLSNIEFVRSWPKLQVVILTLTNIRDITPLEDCPDLEFFECHGTPIDDLSVLADKEKLEYLNIANLPNLRDLTPLYGLKQLKIVRICGSSFTHISQEQVDELKEQLPDTFVSDYGGDPDISGGWRFNTNGDKSDPTERYALLREQMRYDLINWQLMLSNSPSGEED